MPQNPINYPERFLSLLLERSLSSAFRPRKYQCAEIIIACRIARKETSWIVTRRADRSNEGESRCPACCVREPPPHQRIVIAMDIKRDQLTSRVKTFENMLLTARTRKKPNQNEITSCEKQLNEAKKALEEYDKKKKA